MDLALFIDSSCAMNKSLVPPHLIDDIVTNNSVLFVGAGVGAPDLPSGRQLAEELLQMAGYVGELMPLAEAAQYYCQHCDGGQRRRLMRFLRKRLLSCRYPTKAQRLVASIPYFKSIVTTNYDLLLDRALNVTPIVEDSDLAYWVEGERQLVKLHGCITRPNTIVITKEDYAKFLAHRLNGLLCSHLRSLMATRTVIFIGYGLDDYNFRVINEQVTDEVKGAQGQSYAVQLNPNIDDVEYWGKKGISIIAVTAEDFLSAIQLNLVSQNLLVDPIQLSVVMEERRRVVARYQRAESVESPYMLQVSYQDGVLEALSELERLTEGGVTWRELDDRLNAELTEFEGYAQTGEIPEFVFFGR